MRFEDKYAVDEATGCWVWQGSRTTAGYGRYSIGGRWTRAHRLSYRLNVGPIPTGLLVCHHCDNPPCVNPDHLFIGTDLDNIRDREAKGRGVRRTGFQKTHCPQGHPLTEDGSYVYKGKRSCKICRRDQARRYRDRVDTRRTEV